MTLTVLSAKLDASARLAFSRARYTAPNPSKAPDATVTAPPIFFGLSSGKYDFVDEVRR